MVLRGRTQSFVSGYHTSRAASVPVAQYGDSIDVVVQPVVRSKMFSFAPRSYLDADLYAKSNIQDQQFLRDVTSRMPIVGLETRLPPAPIIVDPMVSRVGYVSRASIPPSGASMVHQEHIHHHHRAPSYHRSPLVHRRSDEMDAEVQAFLDSTPQSRYSSYLRSRSSPPSSSYHQHQQHYHRYQPTFHPPPPTFPPSYSVQHQYRPSTIGSSGWTTYGSYSSDIPLSHSTYAPSYHLSTQVSPPSTHQSTIFASNVYRPLANYTPSIQVTTSSYQSSRPYSYVSPVSHHYSSSSALGSAPISIDLAKANRPAPLLSSYSGSSYMSSGLPPSSSSASAASTYTPRSRYDARSYDLPKSSSASRARSSSIDAPHPRANYRDVKAPMSDTRRKVRDLICKTRKDPGYYE